MRIVHLILTRRFAGSERYAVELANAQAGAGHDVTMVLRRVACEDRPDAIASRLDPCVRLEQVGELLQVWQARRIVRRLSPDVAHAHLSRACAALHGLDGRCLRVATLHIEYKRRQHAPLDALIAIAPWQLDAIPAPLRQRSVQIDNWTRSIAPTPGARERIRSELGIASDDVVFGTLGRIEDGKGLDIVAEAWKRAALPSNATLVIAGQGEAFASVRHIAPPEVKMPGFVTAPQDWLAAFDVFISAARREPFGLVLLEAMNSGLPILASESEGACHLASVIGSPLLPIGDIDALASAMTSAFTSRCARRAYPMERFSMEARVADVEAFYCRELARRDGANPQ
ncbi:glycosyltransferase family 4 protein [Xanthomonadaceae bacterium JHOS43]|nr:glycosyltransferase family 4 protein [Xanthomonadaceae bacterium JHOS43]MCX7563799.1 glycosyltransferase family 4 protein [Xanthomonadaceae bacterium XH05]